MQKVPQMASISDLKHRHLVVLAMLENGPVLLASRNHPAAVMVAPELWDRIMERLEEQDDLIDALRIELEIERGESEAIPADIEELEAMARGETIPA